MPGRGQGSCSREFFSSVSKHLLSSWSGLWGKLCPPRCGVLLSPLGCEGVKESAPSHGKPVAPGQVPVAGLAWARVLFSRWVASMESSGCQSRSVGRAGPLRSSTAHQRGSCQDMSFLGLGRLLPAPRAGRRLSQDTLERKAESGTASGGGLHLGPCAQLAVRLVTARSSTRAAVGHGSPGLRVVLACIGLPRASHAAKQRLSGIWLLYKYIGWGWLTPRGEELLKLKDSVSTRARGINGPGINPGWK